MFASQQEVDDLDIVISKRCTRISSARAYYESERKNVCWFTYHASCMCFGTAPEAIDDVNIVHKMLVLYLQCVLGVDETNTHDIHTAIPHRLVIDKHVLGFDVCETTTVTNHRNPAGSKTFRDIFEQQTSMHSIRIMQLSNWLQNFTTDPLDQ